MNQAMHTETFIAELQAIVGPNYALTSADDKAPFLTDWRKRFTGKAIAVVMPSCTEEVAAIVKCCVAAKVPIVTQGGNTGFCGGATPQTSGQEIVLSLKRMSQIRNLDLANQTMTVEAGCILQTIQATAAEQGQLFPLSLGAEGSCIVFRLRGGYCPRGDLAWS